MARQFSFGRRAPESADRPATPMVRLKRGASFEAVILSSDVIGAEIHWIGRTVPHITPVEECEGCQKDREIKWEGYLSVWSPRHNSFHVLPLNPTCDQQCAAYVADHGTLRGAVVLASRQSARNNAALAISLRPGERPVNTLPQPIDVEAVLAHMWGLTKLDGVEVIKQVHAAQQSEEAVHVPFADNGSASPSEQQRQVNRMRREFSTNGAGEL